MSAPTMTRSAYPAAVEELIPRAVDLAFEVGRVPSINRLKAELRIGTDKARALRDAVAAKVTESGVNLAQARQETAEIEQASTVEPGEHTPAAQAEQASAAVPETITETIAGQPLPLVSPLASTDKHAHTPQPVRAGRAPGRLLAWTALLVALAASVAANVAYARHGLGPRLSAGTAPLLVVLAAGLLERVPLTSARWWQRWLAVGGLVFVVLAAFITSYQHQSALLLAYGNPKLSSVLLPFAVDALIVMSSVCLAVIAERRRDETRR